MLESLARTDHQVRILKEKVQDKRNGGGIGQEALIPGDTRENRSIEMTTATRTDIKNTTNQEAVETGTGSVQNHRPVGSIMMQRMMIDIIGDIEM